MDDEEQRPVEQEPVKEPAAKHLVQYNESGGLALRSMADMIAWAESVIRSGFAPRGFVKSSQILVAAQMGNELGLGPAASLRAMYVPPSGRPTLYAEAAHALVLRSGLLEDFKNGEPSGEGDDRAATFQVKRRGMAWKSVSFSVRQAKAAGLVKKDSGWEKYQDRMLKARAKAWALHDVFPDLLLGMPIEDDGRTEEPTVIIKAEPNSEAPLRAPDLEPEPDPLLEEA